jgi:pimeloyl-ACP methyl ester carboxylesterase
MPILRLLLVVMGLMLTLAGPAAALDPATTGVVLMHGKWGSTSNVRPVTEALRQAGFLVETPTMPWAGNRLYDRCFDQAMDEIDAAASRLIAQGAKRIVVAGHSLGGSAAFHYASLGRPGVVAAVLIAPAPTLDSPGRQEKVGDSVERARAMVKAGDGNETGSFLDLNSGDRSRVLPMTAACYLSYVDPEGPASMSRAAAAIGTLPVLWVAPSADNNTGAFAKWVVPKLPADARFERADVTADHMGAPMAGRDRIVEWLRALP